MFCFAFTVLVVALDSKMTRESRASHVFTNNILALTPGIIPSRQEFSRMYRDFQESRSEGNRNGMGIFFFAYGSDQQTYETFTAQVIEAARLFKWHSPEVRLALATSKPKPEFEELFEKVILIQDIHNFRGGNYQNRADGLDRQWLTRILYMTATPFETTLAYDANVIACGSVDAALSSLHLADFDFAAASIGAKSSLPNDLNPHNFALAYKWNSVVALLFEQWFHQQVKSGVAQDDQHTLRTAAKLVHERQDFRLRTLNPAIAAAFASTESSTGFFPRETRVISGSVLVVHDNPKRAKNACATFNMHSPTRRQIVRMSMKSAEVSALNSSECATSIKRTLCKYSTLWDDSGKDAIVPSLIS